MYCYIASLHNKYKSKNDIRKFFLALKMKSFLLKAFFITILPLHSFANPADTTIKGVLVSFRYSLSIFPSSWQTAPVSAAGTAIDASEINRSKLIIARALNKYPAALLQGNLKTVYFLKSMEFFAVGYGGTNSTNTLYLTNDGQDNGYTDTYIEQSFHHEFSSILFRNYPSKIDTIAWKKANIAGFDYNDPEAGVGAIRNNESSQSLDSALSAKGFLTQYAYSGLENDVNTIAQSLFCPEKEFWYFVDRFPRIKQKTKLLIAFYNQLNPQFTENWFRKLAK